jgi:hypothetical protein
VFHCEFSSHRGPKAYVIFRSIFRLLLLLNF